MIQVPSPMAADSYCCCPHATSNNSNSSNNKYERLRRKSLAFLASLFKLRKRAAPTSVSSCLAGMRIDEETMQRSPRLENPALGGTLCRPRSAPQDHHHHHHHHHHGNNRNLEEMSGQTTTTTSVSRIPSTLSVTAVDVVMACRHQASSCSSNSSRGASPSHSILTLTPGRTRNIDQDMEALRLSRQDNPYLQVLASKESLIEPSEESESDDTILMSQEMADTDPLTLAQVHEHLVRSPPPASWSRSPIFHFPHQQQHYHQPQHSPGSKSDSGAHYRTTSPKQRPSQDDQPKSEGSMETRDRHSHTFSLLNPTPIRSFSEVRRMHRSEDSVQLMSSE